MDAQFGVRVLEAEAGAKPHLAKLGWEETLKRIWLLSCKSIHENEVAMHECEPGLNDLVKESELLKSRLPKDQQAVMVRAYYEAICTLAAAHLEILRKLAR